VNRGHLKKAQLRTTVGRPRTENFAEGRKRGGKGIGFPRRWHKKEVPLGGRNGTRAITRTGWGLREIKSNAEQGKEAEKSRSP